MLLLKNGRVVDFTGDADHGVRVYRTAVDVRAAAKAATHQLAPYPYQRNIEERCACGWRYGDDKGDRQALGPAT